MTNRLTRTGTLLDKALCCGFGAWAIRYLRLPALPKVTRITLKPSDPDVLDVLHQLPTRYPNLEELTFEDFGALADDDVIRTAFFALLSSDANAWPPTLQRLGLSRNRLVDVSGFVLPPTLQRLGLRGNRLVDVSGLVLPPTLQSLWLGGNQIVDVSGLRARYPHVRVIE